MTGRGGSLADGVSRRAAGGAAGENAAAEERPFKRSIAVNTTAAETGDFTRCIKPRHWLAVRTDHAAFEISLQTAEGFARQNPQPNRNQRTGTRVEQFMWARSSDQAIAEIFPRRANCRDLGVFAERIVELEVTSDNLMLDLVLG